MIIEVVRVIKVNLHCRKLKLIKARDMLHELTLQPTYWWGVKTKEGRTLNARAAGAAHRLD